MPYITCKDGKTYSRYDQSPYVKQCICEEQKFYTEEKAKCDLDPECVKKRESQYDSIIFTLIFILIIIGVLLFTLIKDITNESERN